MLGQRLRHWHNIKTGLGGRPVLVVTITMMNCFAYTFAIFYIKQKRTCLRL